MNDNVVFNLRMCMAHAFLFIVCGLLFGLFLHDEFLPRWPVWALFLLAGFSAAMAIVHWDRAYYDVE